MTRDELVQKLSINGTINTIGYNLAAIKKYEDSVLTFSKEEQLGVISKTNVAYFLRILNVDITNDSSNVNEVFAFDAVGEEYTESVYAACGELDDEFIIDKAENNDEFCRLSVDDIAYYSFRLKEEKTGKLYAPIFFFVDSSSLIITNAEDTFKKILTNSDKNTYWPLESENLLNSVNVENFEIYREHGEGLIQSIDFDNSLNLIKSFQHVFSVNKGGEVALEIQLSGKDEEDAKEIKIKLDTIALDIVKSVARVKNEEMDKFCSSATITSTGNTVKVNVIVPVSILNILRFNLISSFTDLLEVFPDIHFDFGESKPLEFKDYLAESVIEYQENYQYRSDFQELDNTNQMYGTARLETRVEISKIGYLEKDDKNLYITVKLSAMANENLRWQYKYLDFGIKHVSSPNGKIEFSEDYGVDKLPANKKIGENYSLEQTIVFPKDIKHTDIGEIVTLFTFLEPQEVKKLTITKDDLDKTLELGSGYFTLLGLDQSFIYNFTDMGDSLLEARALNSKGEALKCSGGGTSWVKYPNGLKATRMSPAIEGKIESIELYYVSKFNSSKIELPHPVAGNFSDITKKKDCQLGSFEISPYDFSDTTPLPIDDFFESDIEKWSKASAGPIDVYLAGVSSNWELEVQIYLKSPNHPAFKNSLSAFKIIIDEVTTNSGDIIKRPDLETLKQWEKDNNTFKRTFSWSFTGPFSDRGECSVLREGLSLGIPSNYGGLKTLSGHIVFTMPEEVSKLKIEKLYVGDTVEDPNLSFTVIKYEAGKFHLKINKGHKNLVQIRAINPSYEEYKVIGSDILDDIITVDAVSMHEEYEFTVSTKNISNEYSFNLKPK